MFFIFKFCNRRKLQVVKVSLFTLAQREKFVQLVAEFSLSPEGGIVWKIPYCNIAIQGRIQRGGRGRATPPFWGPSKLYFIKREIPLSPLSPWILFPFLYM